MDNQKDASEDKDKNILTSMPPAMRALLKEALTEMTNQVQRAKCIEYALRVPNQHCGEDLIKTAKSIEAYILGTEAQDKEADNATR